MNGAFLHSLKVTPRDDATVSGIANPYKAVTGAWFLRIILSPKKRAHISKLRGVDIDAVEQCGSNNGDQLTAKLNELRETDFSHKYTGLNSPKDIKSASYPWLGYPYHPH